MGLDTEIQNLAELRSKGLLSEAEFAQAKAKLLAASNESGVGRAANRAVTAWIAMSALAFVFVVAIFAILLGQRSRDAEERQARAISLRAEMHAEEEALKAQARAKEQAFEAEKEAQKREREAKVQRGEKAENPLADPLDIDL